MLSTQALCSWATLVPAPLTLPFFPGPYQPEFGDGDELGLIQQIPGSGLVREATAEQVTLLVTLRARDVYSDDLEKTATALDNAFLAVGNEDIWNTHVSFVDRFGTIYSSHDEPSRQTLFANYVIEMGR